MNNMEHTRDLGLRLMTDCDERIIASKNTPCRSITRCVNVVFSSSSLFELPFPYVFYSMQRFQIIKKIEEKEKIINNETLHNSECDFSLVRC